MSHPVDISALKIHPILLSHIFRSTLPTMLVMFSAGIVALVAPSAAGSGLPELKTIFRGVVLKDFLSGKTLVAKARVE